MEKAGRAEGFSRTVAGNIWHGSNRAQNVGTFHHQKKLGKDRSWQMQKVSGEMEQTGGNSKRRTGRSSSSSSTEMIYNTGKSGDGENYLEEISGNGKLSVWTSVKVRECYSEVERDDEGHSAEKHGLLEAHHRASRRTGRSHLVVSVPSLPAIPA